MESSSVSSVNVKEVLHLRTRTAVQPTFAPDYHRQSAKLISRRLRESVHAHYSLVNPMLRSRLGKLSLTATRRHSAGEPPTDEQDQLDALSVQWSQRYAVLMRTATALHEECRSIRTRRDTSATRTAEILGDVTFSEFSELFVSVDLASVLQ